MKSDLQNGNVAGNRAMTEQALRASESSFRRLAEPAEDGILILDSDTGRITAVSPFLIKLLGLPQSEMLGKTVGGLDPFKDIISDQAMWEQLQKEGSVYFTDLPLKTRIGHNIAVELVGNVYQIGEKKMILCSIRDITKRKQAEAELRDSEQLFRTLAESVPQLVWICEPDGMNIYFNQQWVDYTGLTLEESHGHGWNKPFHPDDRQRAWDAWQAATTKLAEYSLECRLRRADGEYRWWLIRGVPLRTAAGKVLKWFGTCTDIHEGKLAADKLKLFRALIEQSNDAILVVDPATARFLDVNERACQDLGYTRDEMLALKVFDVTTDVDRAFVDASNVRVKDAGHATIEATHRRKDGTTYPVEVTLSSVTLDRDYVVAMIRDITGRQQTEAALRESEHRFQMLAAISPVGIFHTDAQGQTTYVNPRWCKISGLSATEALGDGWLGAVHAEDREKLAGGWQSATRAQTGSHAEYRFVHPDGSIAWVMGQAVPEKDAAGHVVGYVGTITDITERKRAEDALRASETLLKETQTIAGLGSYTMDIPTGAWRGSDVLNQIFGIDKTYECSVEGWKNLIHPNDRAMMADYFRNEVIGQGGAFDKEYRIIRHSDQAERWVHGLGRLEFDAQGHPVKMLGTIQDITENKRAAEALRHSQALYQSLVTQMPAGLFRKDREGRFVVVNPVFCQLKGLSMEEIIGKTPKELDEYQRAQEAAGHLEYPPRQRTLAAQGTDHHERIMRTGETIEVEEAYPQPDGRVEYFHAVKTPVYDAEGRIIGSQGMQFDITERKRAEKALQMFQFATDRAADAVFWMNRDGSFFYVNDEACRSLGYAREELMRLRLFDIDPDYPEERWKENWLRFDRNEMDTNRSESNHRRKDGSTFSVEIMTRHFSTDGVAVRVAFVRDITERKLAVESQARLATAVEQAAESILITDTNGTILYVNPAFEKTSGFTRSEALGQNPRILKSGKQDADFYGRMWEVLRRGEVWSSRLINRRKDGAFYEEEATISPVRDATGTIVNYVAVKRDVTREVQLEAQFRQAQKMEAVGQLASGVAHDFNNILNVIIGYGDLIASDLDPNTPLRTYAEELRTAAERAVGLTKQLLVFSRKQKVELVVLDLNETVIHLEKMLRRLIGENIEMAIVPGKDIGRIKADAGYIGQVLMNLAVNARDAMPKGGKLTIATNNVTLDANDARIHVGTTPGEHVMLTVSDTGTGMTPEVKARIFEALFTTKPAGKGTGLGLATCQAIVQQSGGHIEVDSELGRGTTFRVYFPRVDTPVKIADGLEQTGPLPRGTETLLVVEDEPSVRHLAWKVLMALGYHVLRANNGQDALHLVHEYAGPPIRLVVTDVMMPVMGGKVMADWLKATYPDLKILFTSGYTDDAIAQEGVLEPGIAFLPKPYTPEVLARKVRAMLDNETDTSILRNKGATLDPPSPGSPGNA